MQWGQIKSLLILSFLILDIYLLGQFLEKKELADITVLEEQPSTIEEQLSLENITIAELPEEVSEETYITVKQQLLKEEDLVAFDKKIFEQTFLLDDYFIASYLDDPIKVDENATSEEITKLFQEIAYYPDEYVYGSWNKDLNIIMFFQQKMDRPIYYNQNGLVLLFLDENNEINFYIQTLLGETESLGEKRKLIEPIRAIETLYMANELHSDDEITKVNIGFHTRVPFEGDVQVFVPIWKVNVNKQEDYFVNAIEGFTFSTDEEEFLLDVINTAILKLQVQRSEDSPIDDMLDELKEISDTTG